MSKGIESNIIKDIGKDKTAMGHIIGRLQCGWTYIKFDPLQEIQVVSLRFHVCGLIASSRRLTIFCKRKAFVRPRPVRRGWRGGFLTARFRLRSAGVIDVAGGAAGRIDYYAAIV